MNSFKKNKYIILKKSISKELANFCYDYFLLKRTVAKTMYETKNLSPYTEYFGVWNDAQVPGTYSHYADIVMETLLIKLLPLMENKTKLKLVPNYSYARIYKNGDILERHKDRFSCEISTTLNLGGDEWPIFIENDPKKGELKNGKYVSDNTKGIKVILNPGDMLVYKGNLCEHWRDVYEGKDCAQVFLHYNNEATKGSNDNIFDLRPHLGLPNYFKGFKLNV
jgi:hypothetical protein